MRGFSLVELSIVLVILGLLTGGILTGQNLIRAAELRKTMTVAEEYISAMHIFRDQYFGWPGDLRNASDFWPTAVDGDGDGQIEAASVYATSYTLPDNPFFDGERPQFFIQLNLAGLLEGSYDGSAVLGQGYPRVPAASGKGMFVTGKWYPDTGGNGAIPDAVSSLSASIYLAMTIAQPAWFNVNGLFNDTYGLFLPEEAWNMDVKKDDGLPASGKVVAHGSLGGAEDCTIATGLEYNLTETIEHCGLYWELVP